MPRWPDATERLLSKVLCDTKTRCWNFASLRSDGYGKIVVERKIAKAHRVAYELFVGPIPDGIHLHHRCENPACCNPDHLEPVTPREHNQKSPRNLVSIAAAKTHCPHGHPLTPENCIPSRLKRGQRVCLTCQRAAVRAQYHAKKDEWKERQRRYRERDPEGFKAKSRGYQRAHRQRAKLP